jgi:acyl carrier protein
MMSAVSDSSAPAPADALETRVIEIIAKKKKLNPSAVTLETTFEQLGIDSLDAADLLFTFEDAFAIVVPDDKAHSMRSVRDVVDGLRLLLGKTADAS